MDYKFSIFDRY